MRAFAVFIHTNIVSIITMCCLPCSPLTRCCWQWVLGGPCTGASGCEVLRLPQQQKPAAALLLTAVKHVQGAGGYGGCTLRVCGTQRPLGQMPKEIVAAVVAIGEGKGPAGLSSRPYTARRTIPVECPHSIRQSSNSRIGSEGEEALSVRLSHASWCAAVWTCNPGVCFLTTQSNCNWSVMAYAGYCGGRRPKQHASLLKTFC